MLLYWLFYLVMFNIVERLNPPSCCTVIHCALDDMIPFNELFVIPYLMWFVLLGWLSVYTLFRAPDLFRRFMTFVALTYTVAIFTSLLWPNCQELHPHTMPRSNLLTDALAFIYRSDTSTNVCPSIHVLGSLAMLFTTRRIPEMQTRPRQLFFGVMTLLICLSTVFLKQHSVIDGLAALPLAFLGWCLCFHQRALPLRQTA